ncbi:MAG: hypothetical protein KGO82_18025, partial [Bacteroidota bacterium]|nr:hypothetical protein [Bacteroidota bacterium]
MSRLYFYSLLLSFCCVSCSKQPTSAGTTRPVQGGTNNPDTIGHNIVLYGITWQGGSNNLGTIFRIHGDGTNFESLYNFDAGSGGHCYTGLCQAPNGKFYGVSANNFFSFDPAGNKVELLSGGAVISPVDQVFSGFTLASDGKLYSGASDGLFAVEPASGTLKYVYKYLSSDGRSPIRGRLTAYNDLLYGALPNGGSDLLGEGTLFSFKPSTNSFRKLHDFTGTDTLGGVPLANICVGANNTLYGYTLTTGKLSDTAGILYKYNLGNNTFSRISRLNLENGYSPFCNSGLIQTSA